MMSQATNEAKPAASAMPQKLREQLDRASQYHKELHAEEEYREFREFIKRKEAERREETVRKPK